MQGLRNPVGLPRLGSPEPGSAPVLLVDPNPYNRGNSRYILFTGGIRSVLEAEDGSEALGILSQVTPSAIILAWHESRLIPTEDLVRILRDPRVSADPDIPIIVVSSRPTLSLVRRLGQQGVRQFVRSPYSPRMLLQRVRPTLARNLLRGGVAHEGPLLVGPGRDLLTDASRFHLAI